MQFRVALDAFIQFCDVERRLSPHTTQAYASDLSDFRRWLGPEMTATEVSTIMLKGYLQHMVSEKKLTTSTVRRRLACLRSFFKFVADQEKTLVNPFDGWKLKLPRRKQLPRSLSRAEASALLLWLRRLPLGTDAAISLIVRLMVATGLRVGEVCKLRTDDISPDGTMLRVRGKGSRERVAYVTDTSLAGELHKLTIRRGAGGVAPLFTNRRGALIKAQSVRLQLRKIATDAGLSRRITPHMLRHTAATLLIETGVDIRFVQRLLGHASIATTELYTHVSDEALRSTLARANVLGTIVEAR